MTPELQAYLTDFRGRFEPVLRRFLTWQETSVGAHHPYARAIARVVGDFSTRGGKRMRAALVELGWLATGSRATPKILLPAVAVELLHSYLLVHDDIIDASDLRRGQPTVHRLLERRFGRRYRLSKRTAEDLGQSLAIIAGDLNASYADRALLTADFPADRLVPALAALHQRLDQTIVGQIVDILLPHERAAERDVFLTHRLKTAGYSFHLPLQIGMILGGATRRQLAAVAGFAVPVGVAFQIQDDVLDVFGDPKRLGKPVTSDIQEGKQTLLIVYARALGTPRQRQRLHALVGKRRLTAAEFVEVKTILRRSGALAKTERTAKRLVSRGLRSLSSMSVSTRAARLLGDVARSVVDRQT